MGLLSPAEAAEVAADVALHPELADELARIESDLENMATAGAMAPPAGLDQKIWVQLDQKTGDIPERKEQVPAREIALGRRPAFAWQQAAVWVLLIGSVFLNAWFWLQQSEQKKSQEINQSELAQLRQDQQRLQRQLDQFRQSSQTIFSAGSQLIPLQSLKGGQTYVLLYNTDQQLALFDMSELPPPPDGKQYQMWVIVDGQPQSMGVIPIQKPENGMLEMQQPAVPGQQAFAISLEKEGGNPTPTEVLMLGKTQG